MVETAGGAGWAARGASGSADGGAGCGLVFGPAGDVGGSGPALKGAGGALGLAERCGGDLLDATVAELAQVATEAVREIQGRARPAGVHGGEVGGLSRRGRKPSRAKHSVPARFRPHPRRNQHLPPCRGQGRCLCDQSSVWFATPDLVGTAVHVLPLDGFDRRTIARSECPSRERMTVPRVGRSSDRPGPQPRQMRRRSRRALRCLAGLLSDRHPPAV